MTDKETMVDRVIPFAVLAYASYLSVIKIEENAGTILALWWFGAASFCVVGSFIVLLVPRS